MSEELEVLRIVTARLDAADIPYIVTGSMAVNYYGVPRMTRDIDLVVELAVDDIDRVCELFHGDFYVEREAVRESIERRTAFNIIHTSLVVKVDLVVRKESEYRRTEFARRRRVSLEGHPFLIVTPEDLIISKLEWAADTRSEVQLTDTHQLHPQLLLQHPLRQYHLQLDQQVPEVDHNGIFSRMGKENRNRRSCHSMHDIFRLDYTWRFCAPGSC